MSQTDPSPGQGAGAHARGSVEEAFGPEKEGRGSGKGLGQPERDQEPVDGGQEVVMRVRDITSAIEDFAPLSIQESWDNSGLLVGSPDHEVHGVLVGFDCTPELVDEAAAAGMDMIVTHHPLIFGGLKRISPEDPTGEAVIKAVSAGIAVYAAHTTADKVIGGVSGTMARRLGLKDITVLDEETDGFDDVADTAQQSDTQSDLETYDYETSPEKQDAVNPETSGEFVTAENPYQERWEKLEEEFSGEGNDADSWDSLKDVPFSGETGSDTNGDTGNTELPEQADAEKISDTGEINSVSDYMNAHNYGQKDFATYSQDPQWRQLMRQEYPDYELPELTQESAGEQLSQYMNDHNYGMGDYAEYSQDPVWRELHSAAFPDDELPPLEGAENDTLTEGISDTDNASTDLTPSINEDTDAQDIQQSISSEQNVADISNNEIRGSDPEKEVTEEITKEYSDYKKPLFSKNNIERDYESYSLKDAENLSDEEIKVLKDYTSENSDCSYSKINKSLYDPEFKPANEQEEKMLKDEIKVLTDCLDKKELPRNAELYRGIKTASDIFGDDIKTMSPQEIIEKYTGKEYINPAFTSTSCNKDTAQEFANGAWGTDSGLITIKAPKGTNAMCVGDVGSFGSSESEVLLQRGTIYHLDKIEYDKGQYNIIMTARGNAR